MPLENIFKKHLPTYTHRYDTVTLLSNICDMQPYGQCLLYRVYAFWSNAPTHFDKQISHCTVVFIWNCTRIPCDSTLFRCPKLLSHTIGAYNCITIVPIHDRHPRIQCQTQNSKHYRQHRKCHDHSRCFCYVVTYFQRA